MATHEDVVPIANSIACAKSPVIALTDRTVGPLYLRVREGKRREGGQEQRGRAHDAVYPRADADGLLRGPKVRVFEEKEWDR